MSKDLLTLVKNRNLWALALGNLLMVGTLEGFADVWGVSYLMTARDISKVSAAEITSFVFVGMIFGGPLLAWLADQFKAYYACTAWAGAGMAAIFLVMLFFQAYLSHEVLCLMMFCAGLLCCYQVLIFALGTKTVAPALASLAVAFLNMINMLGGSFFHTVIGSLMDLFWAGHMEGTIRIYHSSCYTYALLAIPMAAILGACVFSMLGGKSKSQPI